MEEMESVAVNGQTACFGIDSSSRGFHDSIESGYLSSLTPHSSGYMSSSYRTRSSSGLALSAKKQHRYRPDASQCEKLQRRRTKLNQLSSTLDYSENSIEEQSSSSLSSVLEPSCTGSASQSLVHSTPSCAHDEAALNGGNRRNWRTTVLITPASVVDFRLISPSPAVPSSSYVATEPMQESLEITRLMKGIASKTKQQQMTTTTTTTTTMTTTTTTTPPRPRIQMPRIVFSPIRRRSSPIAITSAENRKMRELCITDLPVTSEIKPKKLDFSCGPSAPRRSSSSSSSSSSSNNNHNNNNCSNNCSNDNEYRNGSISSRAISNYTGKQKVDFLSLLGEKSNHLNVVSKILSFVADEDLFAVCNVSNTWKRLCEGDYLANARRKRLVLKKYNIKENTWLKLKRSKTGEDLCMSPNSRIYARKGYLIDVKNLLNIQMQQKPPSSPPVSPSKVKFHSFVKVSQD
ncbi:hypothetical protein HN011_012401 [Eciton burchellii]|nr:hypothetical protein HN011_012401 [Eciton burchellii]